MPAERPLAGNRDPLEDRSIDPVEEGRHVRVGYTRTREHPHHHSTTHEKHPLSNDVRAMTCVHSRRRTYILAGFGRTSARMSMFCRAKLINSSRFRSMIFAFRSRSFMNCMKDS